MRVYIAGPYTKGDVAVNVKKAILAAAEVANMGHTPYLPHLTHFWHLVAPQPWEFWIKLDAEWLKVCDCVLRLDGESKGADMEVELAKSLGKPVFGSMMELA